MRQHFHHATGRGFKWQGAATNDQAKEVRAHGERDRLKKAGRQTIFARPGQIRNPKGEIGSKFELNSFNATPISGEAAARTNKNESTLKAIGN
jgi:hypothetical protein